MKNSKIICVKRHSNGMEYKCYITTFFMYKKPWTKLIWYTTLSHQMISVNSRWWWERQLNLTCKTTSLSMNLHIVYVLTNREHWHQYRRRKSSTPTSKSRLTQRTLRRSQTTSSNSLISFVSPAAPKRHCCESIRSATNTAYVSLLGMCLVSTGSCLPIWTSISM